MSRKGRNKAKKETVQGAPPALKTWHLAVIVAAVVIVAGIGYYWHTHQEKEEVEPPTYAVFRTSKGIFKAVLFTEGAPRTCENFIKLARSHFYDGLCFHRITNGIVQGGGFYPDGTEKVSPYGPIKLENSTKLTHDDGALAMARESDPDSATSQFYVCDGPHHGLDLSYAVFGEVIEGMDVVRALAAVEVSSESPVDPYEAVIDYVRIVKE